MPPLQRVLDHPVAPVAPLDAFRAGLVTSRDPSFLAPLSHRVDPSVGGLVDGIAAAAAPRVHAGDLELAVPPRPAPATPKVQRRIPGWSSQNTPAAVTKPSPQPTVGAVEPDLPPSQVTPAETLPGVEALPRGEPIAPVEALPRRALVAVADPGPLWSERPALPLAELPVVSRLATTSPVRPSAALTASAGTARARPAVSAGDVPTREASTPDVSTADVSTGDVSTVDGAPTPPVVMPVPDQGEQAAPLSSFAAAIGALADDDEPAVGVDSTPATGLPVQRSVEPARAAMVVVPAKHGSAEPVPTGPTSAATRSALPAGDPDDDQPLLGGQPLRGVDQPNLLAPEVVASEAAFPESGVSESVAKEPSAQESFAPASAEPALPVVSRSVEHAVARPAPAPYGSTVTARTVPTLGRALAVVRPVTASPVLQRRAAAVPAQPVQYLPVGTSLPVGIALPVGTAPAAPAAALSSVSQRVADLPRDAMAAVVSTSTGSVSPPPNPPPNPAPAAVLQRLAEPYDPAVAAEPTPASVARTARPSVAPPVVLRQAASTAAATALRSTSFAGMFGPGQASGVPADTGVTTVQRDAVPEPSPEPAAEPAPTAPAAVRTEAGAAVATAGAGASATDVEELARRLYEPLSARFRAELWLDRERAGV